MQLSILDMSVPNFSPISAVSSHCVYCELQEMFSIIGANESYLSPLCAYVTSEHCMQRTQQAHLLPFKDDILR